jgi:DNA-binding CsgD family transcriptional regulator
VEIPPLGAEDLWSVRRAALRCLAVDDLGEAASACVEAVAAVVAADGIRVVEVPPGGGPEVTAGRWTGDDPPVDADLPSGGDGPVEVGATGGRRVLAMAVPTRSRRRVWVELERLADGFDERDRWLLHCLQVHLSAAIERATLVTSLRATVDVAAGPTMTIDRDGEVRHVAGEASTILERHLGGSPVAGDALPVELRDLVGTGEPASVVLGGARPDVDGAVAVDHADAAVVVEAVPAGGVDVLRLRELTPTRPAGVLERELRLSSRQAEVLLLVSGGATDRQIAAQLDISPHTVRKHLDMIFRRIDVPNRTAAAQACRAVLAAASGRRRRGDR